MAKIAELFVGLKFKVEGASEVSKAASALATIADVGRKAANRIDRVSEAFARLGKNAAAARDVVASAFPAIPDMPRGGGGSGPREPRTPQQMDAHVRLFEKNKRAEAKALKETTRETNESAKATGKSDMTLREATKGVTKAAAALAALSAGYGLVARMAATTSTAVANFVTMTGIDGGAFQRMAFEASQAGVATEEVASQLKAFQIARNEVLMGFKAPPVAWGVFGINVGDNEVTAFEKMRRRIQGARDIGQARMLASQAGLSEALFLYLRRSNDEFVKLDASLALTDKHAASGRALTSAWAAFVGTLKAAGTRIFAELQEPLTDLLKTVTPLVAKVARFFVWLLKLPYAGTAVKIGILALVAATTALAAALSVVAGILQLAPLLAFFSSPAWAGLIAAVIPFLPVIIAVVAAIAALALAVEDVWTYFQGGKSVLGDVLQLLKDIGNVFTETGDKATAAINRIKGFFVEYRKGGAVFGIPLGPLGGGLSGPMRGIGETLKWLDKRPQTSAAPVVQNNNQSITVTAPAGADEQGMAHLFLKELRGTMDAAYRQITSNFDGPAEERP